MEDRIPMAYIREVYARWWFACEAADTAFTQLPESRDAEDLGDFVDAMSTMRSFGPNPRTFPESPYSFDPANPA